MTQIFLTTKGDRHSIFVNDHTRTQVCNIISCFVESVAAWMDAFHIEGRHEIEPGCARIDFVGHDDVFDLLCESMTGLAATCPDDVTAKVQIFPARG